MQEKKILVCPLNWGLGHATRLIPIINNLLENNCKVVIGGSGYSLELLTKRFPFLQSITIPSKKINYSSGRNQFWKLIFQLPGFYNSIKKEQKVLSKIVKDIKPDVIISDNRYGLHHPEIMSVIITHQIFPISPRSIKIFERLVHNFISRKIIRFHQCWIPDVKGESSLAGKLISKRELPRNSRFIGLLSRFGKLERNLEDEFENDILVILSGPEPQRSKLEKMLFVEINKLGLKAVFLQGKPGEIESTSTNNIRFLAHSNDEVFIKLVNSSRYIIARAGYSTIMDLCAMQRNAILIPTPGQTEQEYLAFYLKKLNWFHFTMQEKLDLKKDLLNCNNLSKIDMESRFFKTNYYGVLFHGQKTI